MRQTELPLRDSTTSSATTGGILLSDRQRTAWLRLWRTDNVGPVSFRHLVNRFGSAEAALEALPELASRGGAARVPKVPSLMAIEDELAAVSKAGGRIVAAGEPDFPALLQLTPDSAPLVTIKGNPAVFRLPGISVVGARNASIAGIRFTRKLAMDMGEQGYATVSGLARGIDTAAHTASLDTGTIAVLAGGLAHPYPPENIDLFHAISDKGGAVISEMPLQWEPRAKDFPRRNRIIAALGLGLLVVEAAQRSGSLISARLANELGRLVFAVPGSPLDPRCEGTNNLIRNGATLVTCAADVIEALRPLSGDLMLPPTHLAEAEAVESDPDESSSDLRQMILDSLGPTPVAIDEIIAHTGAKANQIYLILLELDLAGRLQRHSGGAVSLLMVDG